MNLPHGHDALLFPPGRAGKRMSSARDATRVRDEAAAWFARRNGQDISADDQARFAAWLAADEQHRHEYELLDGLWAAADLIPPARLRRLSDAPRPGSRRRFVQLAAATVAAMALGLGWVLLPAADYHGTLQTRAGERQDVTLPDGSVVQLNSLTQLVIHYQSDRRAVELQRGEALFSVSHDPSRPFMVTAGPAQVRVTGTRFDVLHEGREVRVAVESGTVQVTGKATEQPVVLSAGTGTRIDNRGQVAPAQAINLNAVMAWREGKLVFDNATLAEVAAQVSRYREQPLHVDPTLANLRLSSVLRTDDTDSLLSALPHLLPVRVRLRADGSSEIIPI